MITVIGPATARIGANGVRELWSLIRCEHCGREKEVRKSNARRMQSCGCVPKSNTKTHGEAHGRSRTKEYRCWASIKTRCTNPNTNSWELYGARGIRMHESWVDSFETFLRDVGRAPSRRHSIDRINNDGNYEPGNVRWASVDEQARNRRNNRRLGPNGELLVDGASLAGVDVSTFWKRLRRGWSWTEAVSGRRA